MKIQRFALELGTHVSGIPLQIHGYHLDSERPGKRVYIQGGIHGGEITYWIIQKLYTYVQKDFTSGSVILIPVANPVSWMSRMYFTTAGKFDWHMGKDWNRNFPGNPEGSLGERIAYALFQKALTCDVVIDLHTSRNSFPFGMVNSHRNLSLAKIIGLEYTNVENETDVQYDHCLTTQLEKKGVPNITLECGSHDSYNPKNITLCYQGILRLLKYLHCIKGDTSKPPPVAPKYYTQLVTYRAPKGGFIRFVKTIGNSYRKGEILFTISTVEDILQETKVSAQENGIVEKTSPTYIYWPGDEVMQTIPTNTIKQIP